ncbi:MAG: M56 family metallopeptidase [Egibacteraceae bacterium]
MPPVPSAGGQGGFLLSLVTESFAVRALLGSLAALALAALMVRCGAVRSSRARRLLILAPVLTAALAGLASLRDAEAYLPQLWITTAAATGGAAGQFLDLLGDLRVMSHHRQMDLLVVAYIVVVGALLLRRVAGMVAVRSLLRRARPPVGSGSLVALAHDFAARMQVRVPRVVFLDACPGGAFTVGCRRPVVALDPALLQTLDAAEIEGLIAHELAHISRRDAPLGLVVGVFRDLTFFLPPLHLAGGWLRREQEESADELASVHTGRPAALASGILKVWDCSRAARRGPQVTCAAVAGRRVALAWAVEGSAADPPLRGAAKVISLRVERLIARTPAIPMWRRRAETVLAAAVLAAATTASLAVPGWLAAQHDADMLAFAYLTAQPATAVESPAFATFRQLAPPAIPAAQDSTTAAAASAGLEPLAATAAQRGQCPCVEGQAQLRQATPTTSAPAPAHMLWRSGEQRSWELDPLQREGRVRAARPLFTLSDSGPQVGFFLVGGTS